MTRRDVNRVLASVGIATVSVPLAGNWAHAATNLYLYTWAVYDSAELHPVCIASSRWWWSVCGKTT